LPAGCGYDAAGLDSPAAGPKFHSRASASAAAAA